jgi:RHS repeat-associated protein
VWSITNNRDTNRTQTFNYDQLNRLISAQNAGTDCTQKTLNGGTEYWGNSYNYDPWGNLTKKIPTKCSAESLNESALANNQLHTISGTDNQYDAAGNLTFDATAGLTYTFDAENRITGAGGYAYTYDDDGNRVEKSNGATGTLYWYMSPGIVAESDLNGNLTSEYVFFGGRRVARRDNPATSGPVFYYFSDRLNTAAVVTDSAGNIKEDEDFYPWGGELQFVNNDSNHYKFGGHERDSETGLDYMLARYYSNPMGRFLTPDWAAKPTTVPYANFGNPQSLNLYTFGKNNPTTFGDPDGHCFGVFAPVCAFAAAGASEGAEIGATAGTVAEPGGGTVVGGAGGLVIGGIVGGVIGIGVVAYRHFHKDSRSSSSSNGNSQSSSSTSSQSTPAVPPPPPAPGNNQQNGSKDKKQGTSGGDRAGKKFTPKGKAEVKAENAANHGGQTTCERCGQSTVPAEQSKAGVTPPDNESHVDHIIPQSKNGDGSPSNGQLLCRACNLKKSDKMP